MNDTFKTLKDGRSKRGPYKTAQRRLPGSGSTALGADIEYLGYHPQAPYRLDLEIFTTADLRQRGGQGVRTTHRYGFHTLVCVTQGECTQLVDFKSIACGPGSVVVVRAGQAHNYGRGEDWDGWNVLFRPEFVLPVAATAARGLKPTVDLDRLPEHIVLGDHERLTVTHAIEQMRQDTLVEAPLDDLNALLRHQLYALLKRLAIQQGQQRAQAPVMSLALQRFKRFQQLVDERFAQWHQVADYASQLGYTEKSLARAVQAATGTTAKSFVAARINLEAKRLLVHTDMSVATIADKLGFEEATNFSKFFKREALCTPVAFRRRQLFTGEEKGQGQGQQRPDASAAEPA